MAENPRLPQVQADRLRVATLATNGNPLPGDDTLYTTRAFTSVAIEPNYTDAQEIDEPAADGVSCVQYAGDDTLKRFGITIALCSPDPYMQARLSAGVVLEGEGEDAGRVGYAGPAIGPVSSAAISVEVWAKRILNGTLDNDSPYAWWVYPKVTNLRVGNWTHQNGALLPTYVGRAFENASWGAGPLNDFPATSDRAYQWFPTATLPAASTAPEAIPAS